MRRLTVFAAVGAMVLLGLVGTGGPARAAYPGPNGRISFNDCGDNGCEIYSMLSDGSGVTQLTNFGAVSLFPDWSPDGRQIAFDSDLVRPGPEIFVMNADGSGVRQVTHLGGFAGDPSWSPDATTLVFEHAPPQGCCQNIYSIRPDGTGLHQVTHFVSDVGPFEPEFSPDGHRIAFWEFSPGGGDFAAIFVMRADGSDIRQVTPLQMDADHPEWSPDGSKIIFNNDARLNVGDIFTIHPDGSGLTQLTNVIPRGWADFRPDYSPDGTKIVFDQLIPGQDTSVLVMNANGSKPKVINAHGFGPDWGTHP